MSLGLLDDDNPWNDALIPPITTPDTGLASAAVAAAADNYEEAVHDRSDTVFNSVPNGHVAGAKPVGIDATPLELNKSDGHPPAPASRAANSLYPASIPPAGTGAAS